MLFEEIIGQEHIKNHLKQTVENGRISHAQLFIGNEGCGTLPLAIAYAQYIICSTKNEEDKKSDDTFLIMPLRILDEV